MEKASSLAGDWLVFERFNDGLKSFVVADEGSLILRLLSGGHCQYLGKAEFVLRTAGAPYEIAHFLAPSGIEYLTELGEAPPEYALERQGQVRHRFLEHVLALSEFRLKLELALRNLPSSPSAASRRISR